MVVGGSLPRRWTGSSRSEDEMNEKCGGGNPNRWLLLLIPVSLMMVAKSHRRHMAWGHGWEHGRGFGHVAPGGGPGSPADTFRLPPKIEAILESWHTRAHAATDATEPPTA
jgi:hypothetical protein